MDSKNSELIERLQNSDKEAFNELYRKYNSAIYSNILKLTRDFYAAEDILQEVFITLWEKRSGLDVEQEISGWLFVVSYNKSITYLKGKLKESLTEKAFQQIVVNSTVLENSMVNTRMNIFQRAIDQLSPQKRRVFELCKLQRKTYAEAARELQISKHTVKEYLSGAVIFIKKHVNNTLFTVIYLKTFLL